MDWRERDRDKKRVGRQWQWLRPAPMRTWIKVMAVIKERSKWTQYKGGGISGASSWLAVHTVRRSVILSHPYICLPCLLLRAVRLLSQEKPNIWFLIGCLPSPLPLPHSPCKVFLLWPTLPLSPVSFMSREFFQFAIGNLSGTSGQQRGVTQVSL